MMKKNLINHSTNTRKEKKRTVIGVTSPKTPLPLKMQHFEKPFTKIKKLAFPVACRPILLKKKRTQERFLNMVLGIYLIHPNTNLREPTSD